MSRIHVCFACFSVIDKSRAQKIEYLHLLLLSSSLPMMFMTHPWSNHGETDVELDSCVKYLNVTIVAKR